MLKTFIEFVVCIVPSVASWHGIWTKSFHEGNVVSVCLRLWACGQSRANKFLVYPAVRVHRWSIA